VVTKRYAMSVSMSVTALGMALGVTGCSGKSDTTAQAAKIPVGIILPESITAPRWEAQARPAFEAAFRAGGVKVTIENAANDPAKMAAIADKMIAAGVKVLAISPLDTKSGIELERKAKEAGVTTISFDQFVPGGSAAYHVAYDSAKVGQLVGQGLQSCFGPKAQANLAFLGGESDDPNARLMVQGAVRVLGQSGRFHKVAERTVPLGDQAKASAAVQAMWAAQRGKIDGIMADDDQLGAAAIAILKKQGLAGKVQVSGQDATLEGLRHILDGSQCMTVAKSTRQEAGAVAQLAVALAKGAKGVTNGVTKDTVGKRTVPSVLLSPVLVTKATVKLAVNDGVDTATLCAGSYAKLCKANGVV
jgi:D-xylose transport system substrate-binding protein